MPLGQRTSSESIVAEDPRFDAGDPDGRGHVARYAARAPVALSRIAYDADTDRVSLASDKAEGPTPGGRPSRCLTGRASQRAADDERSHSSPLRATGQVPGKQMAHHTVPSSKAETPMRRSLSVLLTLPLLTAPSESLSTTYAVPGDTFPTLVHAAASGVLQHGDILELPDSTLGIGFCNVSFQDVSITIRSASGDSASCVIDCGGRPGTWGLAFVRAGDSVVENITIRNGTDSSMGLITTGS